MTTLTDRVYSLRQAADLTGFSEGKFRYNKALLVEHGVVVDDEGWRVPHSVLVELGWLGVKQPRRVPAAPSALEVAEARVRELEVEVERLRGQVERKGRGLFGRKR